LARKRPVLLDRGAGGEEAGRVDDLVRRLGSPGRLHVHDGSYASFASHIMQSRLYVGYDSAGQHVAAAAGIPLVSTFKGFPNEIMLSRWGPDTPGSHIVAVREDDPTSVSGRTLAAISVAEAAVPMAASTD
jgi:ADP-heptose:LPS heptosyltransferase